MQRVVIGIVIAGLIFLGSGIVFANGQDEGEKEGFVEHMTPARGTALKSPGFATILSLLIPGLGQVYNGDSVKALVMGSIEGVCWIMLDDMDAVGLFGMGVGRLVSSVDAYYSALEKNKGISFMIDNEKVLLSIKRDF